MLVNRRAPQRVLNRIVSSVQSVRHNSDDIDYNSWGSVNIRSGKYSDAGSKSPFDTAKPFKAHESRIMRKVQYRHNWDFEGHNQFEVADELFMQEADPEDPFDEHPLPFYMEYQWNDKIAYETQLRTGVWWHPRDRIQKYFDAHAWEMSVQWAEYRTADNHMYRSVFSFLQYPDVLNPWDNKYEYEMKQLENHISMLKYTPHTKPLQPQLAKELWDLNRTRVTQLKEKYGVDGINYLEPGEEMKRMRSSKNMYKAPETGPLTTPFFGERPSNLARLPPEQGRAIKKWREMNPEVTQQHPDSSKAILAKWLQEFEEKVDALWAEKEVDKHKWVKIFYIDAMGDKHRVYGMVGETLLETSRRWEIPLDGLCMGGDRTEVYTDGPRCQYCQIDVAPRWVHTLPPMDWREEYFTKNYRVFSPTSRLACQIIVTDAMDGFTCAIPQMEGSVNSDMDGYTGGCQ